VEHIDAVVVLEGDVCAMLDEELASVDVSFKTSVVEAAKTVFEVFAVDPSSDLVLWDTLLLTVSEENLNQFSAVHESRLMEEGFTVRTHDVAHVDKRVFSETLE
jgi:hypothetical protein